MEAVCLAGDVGGSSCRSRQVVMAPRRSGTKEACRFGAAHNLAGDSTLASTGSSSSRSSTGESVG
eukprot:4172581-Alexandrium_andersonii.AAC.1